MTDGSPVVVSLHVEAFGGSSDEEHEIPRVEWDLMGHGDREELLQRLVDEHLASNVSAGWHIEDPDDYRSVYA